MCIKKVNGVWRKRKNVRLYFTLLLADGTRVWLYGYVIANISCGTLDYAAWL